MGSVLQYIFYCSRSLTQGDRTEHTQSCSLHLGEKHSGQLTAQALNNFILQNLIRLLGIPLQNSQGDWRKKTTQLPFLDLLINLLTTRINVPSFLFFFRWSSFMIKQLQKQNILYSHYIQNASKLSYSEQVHVYSELNTPVLFEI